MKRSYQIDSIGKSERPGEISNRIYQNNRSEKWNGCSENNRSDPSDSDVRKIPDVQSITDPRPGEKLCAAILQRTPI